MATLATSQLLWAQLRNLPAKGALAQVPVEQLFKFVSVRPPKPAPEPRILDNFIPYDVDPESLVERVIELDWPAGKRLAEASIDAAPTILDFQGLAHSAGLVAVRSAIARGRVTGGSIEELEQLLGWTVREAVGQQAFTVTKMGLRDAYAAHCLALGDRPEQREKALLSLRTLHFLQGVGRDPGLLDNRRRLGRVLRARVILPTEFLQKKSAARGDPPQDTGPIGPVTPSPGGPIHFTPDNLERLKLLYAIKHELRGARRRNREERTDAPALVAGGNGGATSREGEITVSGTRSDPPSGILAPTVVESLSRPTLGLLTKSGASTDYLDVEHGLRAVGSEIRRLRTLFLHGVPTSTMVAVDRLIASWDLDVMPDVPTDLFEVAAAADPVGTTPSSGVGPVQPLGVGELLIVEQTLQKYEAGEISHVENVLQTESFKRSFRALNRTEQTVFTATATTEESERDLQSTDRFELSTQAEKTIAQDMSAQAGVTTSASYGPVSVGAYGDFATSTSTTESTSSATTFAQDVTDRSVSTITTEIREEQTTRILQESEEITEHGFDNTNGQGNVAGIYQWLDKKYEAQMYDYGLRQMYEFLVPVPSSFYRHALDNQPMTGVSLAEPEPLSDLQPSDLDEDNYQDYVSRYAVSGVGAPPAETTIVGTVFDQTGLAHNATITKTEDLAIPPGYRALVGRFTDRRTWFGDSHFLGAIIGSRNLDSASDEGVDQTLEGEDTSIPVGVIAAGAAMIIAIEVVCERTTAAMQDWQQETYDAIVAAYNAQKSAYDSQVSAAGFTANSTGYGGSESDNRRIEREELKKGSLTMLARQYFENFDAMHLAGTASGLPEFDVDEAMDEGDYAQFFEQAFEWDQMTYLYYPYFWMNKTEWLERFNLQSTDALFADFLRAGYARVVVPVTPAYDDAVLYYLSSGGQIWNGGDPPTIDDPLYVSIADELGDATAGRTPYGEPWEVTIPTTLVYLKADSTLPDWTTTAP